MTKQKTSNIYQRLEEAATAKASASVKHFQIGLTWTSCVVEHNGLPSIGFAMTPAEKTRVLTWPGTIKGKSVAELSTKLYSWNAFETTLALAACNAAINVPDNQLLETSTRIHSRDNANLSVFLHFKEKLIGKKVVVIGRYPALDSALEGLDYHVLERQPGPGDLPDTAAEWLIPEADWVFLTATSIINKTFHRLCELSKHAVTVLMGPTVPWLEALSDFDIDFVAGVRCSDINRATQIASEGGGTRLFEGGVEYSLANLSERRLQTLKGKIAETVSKRNALKAEMETWYHREKVKPFPQAGSLDNIDTRLSALDTAFKRLWDANQ